MPKVITGWCLLPTFGMVATMTMILRPCPYHQLIDVHVREVLNKPPDVDKLRPNFGWISPDIIRRTFDCTTQYARIPQSEILKKAYRSPYPGANAHRRDEALCTDTGLC